MGDLPSWVKVGARCVCIYEVKDFGPRLGERCVVSEVDADAKGHWLFIEGYDGWVPTAPGQKTRHSFLPQNFRPLVSDSDELGIETILYRQAGLKSKVSVRKEERA